jgi:hypothetical protein
MANDDRGDQKKRAYDGKPFMIHPEKKTAWGFVVRGQPTLNYDHTTRSDKARLYVDACKLECISGSAKDTVSPLLLCLHTEEPSS